MCATRWGAAIAAVEAEAVHVFPGLLAQPDLFLVEEIERLRLADQRHVEGQHGGKAVLVEAVPVKETFQGQIVWEGTIHVFDLEGHPKATRAYAW